mmetsp:Transcript_93838/g.236447  ORF Transcript_93838/g.236447 Transcript_93838/m.236447 type:complete len:218 (+) Transcript_93838:540-1193(+)
MHRNVVLRCGDAAQVVEYGGHPRGHAGFRRGNSGRVPVLLWPFSHKHDVHSPHPPYHLRRALQRGRGRALPRCSIHSRQVDQGGTVHYHLRRGRCGGHRARCGLAREPVLAWTACLLVGRVHRPFFWDEHCADPDVLRVKRPGQALGGLGGACLYRPGLAQMHPKRAHKVSVCPKTQAVGMYRAFVLGLSLSKHLNSVSTILASATVLLGCMCEYTC